MAGRLPTSTPADKQDTVTTTPCFRPSSTLAYLPFGVTRTSSGTLNTDRRFTGQRLDQTGLYFYNARFYDATIGRFASADSIVPDYKNPQELNRYTYCLNNPLKYTDPTGHDSGVNRYEGHWYWSPFYHVLWLSHDVTQQVRGVLSLVMGGWFTFSVARTFIQSIAARTAALNPYVGIVITVCAVYSAYFYFYAANKDVGRGIKIAVVTNPGTGTLVPTYAWSQ